MMDITKKEKIDGIIRLHNLMLGRMPSSEYVSKCIRNGSSLYDIQLDIYNSDEFKSRFIRDISIDSSDIDYDVEIYVINLERRADRREHIIKELSNLNLTKYKLIKAVDGNLLSSEDLSKVYDKEKGLRLHRELGRSEIACSFSHILIAREIVEKNIPFAIVFEDDAIIKKSFKKFLSSVHALSDVAFDFILLGVYTSNQFFNGNYKRNEAPNYLITEESIVYLSEPKIFISDEIILYKPHHPSMNVDYLHGTHAYVISNEGARKLLNLNYPIFLEPDNIWNFYADKVNVYITNPTVADVIIDKSKSDLHHDRILLNYNENFSSKFHDQRIFNVDYGS